MGGRSRVGRLVGCCLHIDWMEEDRGLVADALLRGKHRQTRLAARPPSCCAAQADCIDINSRKLTHAFLEGAKNWIHGEEEGSGKKTPGVRTYSKELERGRT